MMETVLSGGTADKVLTGGLVANILLAAKGEQIGASSLRYKKSGYDVFIENSVPLLERYGDKIVLRSTRRIWTRRAGAWKRRWEHSDGRGRARHWPKDRFSV